MQALAELRRHSAKFADVCAFIRLTHQMNILHIEGSSSIDLSGLPVQIWHLDFYLTCCTLTNRPWKPFSAGTERVRSQVAALWSPVAVIERDCVQCAGCPGGLQVPDVDLGRVGGTSQGC
jgi:trimethylamine:corrinoid methyltransferase-like protein